MSDSQCKGRNDPFMSNLLADEERMRLLSGFTDGQGQYFEFSQYC